MYSLFVSNEVADRTQGAFDISINRFLEYTSESISGQLHPLSIEAMDCIKSWPCVLMQEGRGQERALIVEIKQIQPTGGQVKLTVTSLPNGSVILNDTLWKNRTDLDIEQFEFNRNHWAIKDRSLFAILAANGHRLDATVVSRFENKPLPAPPRQALLGARNAISKWSHTEIDDFLLEAGVTGLEAGRAIGSRRDRANAILEFAFKNPYVTTVENSLFSAFVVRRTSSSTDNLQAPELSITGEEVGKPPQRRDEGEPSGGSPNRVFVVHGQNEAARSAIISFLARVGLHGIVLHEQPSMGRHLLTKFVDEAELVTFAIVLMTDDDVGGLKDGELSARARQNVILELGYFLSHLGQQRVCALITPGLETPSDFDGIVGSWPPCGAGA